MSVETVAASFKEGVQLLDEELWLQLPQSALLVKSNSHQLLEILRRYFAPWVSRRAKTRQQLAEAEILVEKITAIERPPLEMDITWRDWFREAGKSGRKDTCYDLPEGRLIRKVRTGMVFLQSRKHRLVAGPCTEHCNQVINFIGNQYMNFLQQQQWRICHAAGLAHGDRALAIAGFSGGGKSTLMLHLLDDPRLNFVSNDRLFIKTAGADVLARGIPKLPRINPGTIVNNQRLRGILSAEECRRYQALPVDELWQLEQKYDVDIEQVYGEGRITDQAVLTDFIVHNWSITSNQKIRIESFPVAERPELLAAVMKSSGPFYQYKDGRFYQDGTVNNEDAYTKILSKVNMTEVSGRIDFSALKKFCLKRLLV